MPHAIWSGSISFGLVTIPVKLFTAVRESEGVHFHLLHEKDKGRIKNLRKCSVCEKDVAWGDLVKGFEYEKGEYVVVTDEELKKYRPEATQSIDIVEFVDGEQIDPILYDKPYYLEPEKKGRHAYALLREALKQSGKVGIAKVVLRTREYLCALKPTENALVLEMMHFAHEIVPTSGLDLPAVSEKTPEGEMKAALMLINAMAKDFEPEAFHDEYTEKLKDMLEARAKGAPAPSEHAAPHHANVVDLMDVLQKSLAANKAKKGADDGTPAHGHGHGHAHAQAHAHEHESSAESEDAGEETAAKKGPAKAKSRSKDGHATKRKVG